MLPPLPLPLLQWHRVSATLVAQGHLARATVQWLGFDDDEVAVLATPPSVGIFVEQSEWVKMRDSEV